MCILPYLAYKPPTLFVIQLPDVSSTIPSISVPGSSEEIPVLTALHQAGDRRQVPKEAVIYCALVCREGTPGYAREMMSEQG